jgi:two-component system cell cycle response regulator
MRDARLDVLNQARRSLELMDIPPSEQYDLLLLLEAMITAIENYTDLNATGDEARWLESGLIDSHALLLQLKQQAAELDALKKLSLNLTSSLDLQTVLDAVVSEAMKLVKNARTAHIFLYNAEQDRLDFGAALDSDGQRDKVWIQPRPHGLTYTVARSGEVISVEDMRVHPLYKGTTNNWFGSIIGIPLRIGGKTVGAMNLSRFTTGTFSDSELRLLRLLADQAAIAIVNARLHETVSKQAYSDTVTGLPNRRALEERLEEEIRKSRRTGQEFALIMMDLDGFKVINDNYGHPVGDQVLRLVFNYLAQGVRTSDFLARYGGDEMTLILTQTDLPPALLVVEKLQEKLRHLDIALPDGKKTKMDMSGGIAIFPVHAGSGPSLVRAADEALYRAKKHERGQFLVARGQTGPLPEPTRSRESREE